jgi:hypothetical protein
VSSLLAPASGLHRLWRRLATPVDPAHAADALAGVPPAVARRLLAVALAASPEADALLDAMPAMLRSLAVSTASVPQRCDGEIRGPVMWSATLAARSASPGAGAVFICASPTKAYDTDENRVLVASLLRLLRAARIAENEVEEEDMAGLDETFRPPTADVRRARHNGEQARRALEHRSLQAVSRVPPTGRMIQKARSGTKAGVFRWAVALLQRSWAEVGADDLAPFVDAVTRADHLVAADVLDVLAARGQVPARARIVDGRLVAGDFAYAHPSSEAVRLHGVGEGVTVGGHAVRSVADLG